jgi:hypothetical protein
MSLAQLRYGVDFILRLPTASERLGTLHVSP